MADFSSFLDSAAKIAQSAASATKNTARSARLSMEISAQREKIRKAYTELGRLYYESHGRDPEGFFVQLCAEVDAANARIRELEAEKKASGQSDTSDPGADFDTIVDSTAAAAVDPMDIDAPLSLFK